MDELDCQSTDDLLNISKTPVEFTREIFNHIDSMSEETINLRQILMENADYQLDNMSHFDIPLRIENVFTAKELNCGSDAESSFSFMDVSLNTEGNNANEMTVTITNLPDENEARIPTFEINDSDEDVIFVAEYNTNMAKDVASDISRIAHPSPIDSLETDTTSSSSSSTEASPKLMGSNEPRRNPTRRARNLKYKKKCSEYITEEDLNILIESDGECTIVKVDEISTNVKELRPKKVVVNNWPAEGLHERPEYNEQTEEIEKFDFSIRQIQNSVKGEKLGKPKKLKAPKKKYVAKKYNYKRKNNAAKKKEVEMVPLEELRDLITETHTLLSDTFMKTVIDSRRAGLHICTASPKNEDKENEPEEHYKCLTNYDKLIKYQSNLYCLGNEEVNFEETYNNLRNKLLHNI